MPEGVRLGPCVSRVELGVIIGSKAKLGIDGLGEQSQLGIAS